MSTTRNALGRGLGALISSTPGSEPSAAERDPDARAAASEPGPSPGPRQISVSKIVPNPEQPRRIFDPGEIERLSESIRTHGVLQPVVVREAGEGRYELVVGERRWRASRAAGLDTVPAVVADISDGALLEVALVENVQRHDLNPMELAHAYQALAQAGATQEKIGERVGVDRSSVANHLRLLELSREMQTDLEEHRISFGHAKALLSVANPERRRHVRDRIVRDQLSVRQAEALARGGAPHKTPAAPRDRSAANAESAQNAQIAELLQKELQTRVRIQTQGRGGGRIEIDYAGFEDLERIIRVILEGS